ncbi:MAG: hypothetical protein ACRDRL_31595 [Sciscionella sp.]
MTVAAAAWDPCSADHDRAEYRAFIRRHHPDVGGDPEFFRLGLARYRDAGGPESRRGAPDSGSAQDRFDGPISFVATRRGLPGGIDWVARWWQRRRRGPRVR